jgi:glucokinase
VIGISAPGLPNEDNSAIAFMPGRLQGLENFIWSDFLGVTSFVLNGAISAMMAEARFGAAKGRKNAIMITLGTGVGGAILIDGNP